LRWDPDLFCHALRDRTILLLGDSTMHQAAYTLHEMIAFNSTGHGRCAHQVVFGRTDRLYPEDHQHNFRSFAEYVKIVLPDIVVLNAGAHMSDVAHMNSIFEGLLKQVMDLRDNTSNTTVAKVPALVWKTLSPGHYLCSRATEPIQNFTTFYEQALLVDNDNDTVVVNDTYRYQQFPAFDAMSQEWQARIGYKMLSLDPLYLRADAHVTSRSDCLHMCTPGPLDLFAVLLMNMLHNEEL
jgi:hypothetical protein